MLRAWAVPEILAVARNLDINDRLGRPDSSHLLRRDGHDLFQGGDVRNKKLRREPTSKVRPET